MHYGEKPSNSIKIFLRENVMEKNIVWSCFWKTHAQNLLGNLTTQTPEDFFPYQWMLLPVD